MFKTKRKSLEALVAYITTNLYCILNKGSTSGIKIGDRFNLYVTPLKIFDPITGEYLDSIYVESVNVVEVYYTKDNISLCCALDKIFHPNLIVGSSAKLII